MPFNERGQDEESVNQLQACFYFAAGTFPWWHPGQHAPCMPCIQWTWRPEHICKRDSPSEHSSPPHRPEVAVKSSTRRSPKRQYRLGIASRRRWYRAGFGSPKSPFRNANCCLNARLSTGIETSTMSSTRLVSDQQQYFKYYKRY